MSYTLILTIVRRSVLLLLALRLILFPAPIRAQLLASNDLSRPRSIGSVTLSPDNHYLAYTIVMRDRPGRPYDQLWVMDLSTEKSIHLAPASTPLWSPDSRWLAFRNADGNNSGLWIAHPDASDTTLLATLASTNSPLPGMGKRFAWSADSKQIAFVSSTPAEPADNNNDSFSFDFGCFELFEGSGACFRGWRRNEKVPVFRSQPVSKTFLPSSHAKLETPLSVLRQ